MCKQNERYARFMRVVYRRRRRHRRRGTPDGRRRRHHAPRSAVIERILMLKRT
jgi:hypothetical protein